MALFQNKSMRETKIDLEIELAKVSSFLQKVLRAARTRPPK